MNRNNVCFVVVFLCSNFFSIYSVSNLAFTLLYFYRLFQLGCSVHNIILQNRCTLKPVLATEHNHSINTTL